MILLCPNFFKLFLFDFHYSISPHHIDFYTLLDFFLYPELPTLISIILIRKDCYFSQLDFINFLG